MRKNIGNVICVLLISSLTLLGCSSENDTTNTEVEYLTKQSVDSETEEMTTEEISTEEISTEEISTEVSDTEVPSEESNPTDISKDEDTPVNTNSDKGTKNTDSSDNTGNANGDSNKTNNTTGNNNTDNNDTTSQTVPEASTPEASAPEVSTPETSTPAIEQPADPYFIDSNAEQVLALVNQARAEVGLPGLTLNSTLLSAAHVRASEIAVSFSHTRPDGRSCFTAIIHLLRSRINTPATINTAATTSINPANPYLFLAI